MSLESTLERIATALEIIAGNVNAPVAPSIEPVKTEAVKIVKVTKAAKITEDTVAPGPAEAQADVPPPAPVTLEQVLASIRIFADKNGSDKAKAIMVKYGADVKKPMSKDIKPENYGKLLKEIGG